jgi:eukaryotic-like serine/threonine-protein kinase
MNPLNILRRQNPSGGRAGQARMTWASGSLSHSVSRAGLFLKKQLWVWPIVAVVVLSVGGFAVRAAIESTMKSNLRSSLQTLLDVETAMLETWFEVQASNAETLANDAQVRELIYGMLEDADDVSTQEAVQDSVAIQKKLQKTLAPAMSSHDYVNYFVTDKSKKIVSSTSAILVGQQDVPEFGEFLARTLEGETVVCAPFAGVVMEETESGRMRMGLPTMYVSAPVRDASFQVIGALALQIRPEREFTRVLQLGRIGESGETYAFNKSGVMVSNSRFDEDLILLGLLPDTDESRSILTLMIRDPQGNVTEGFRPAKRRSQLPLTRMAADAIAGNANVDVEGYADYRGVPVVGAWKWLPEYGLGVTTEIDVAEAFRPLVILQTTFWSLYTLLILSSAAIFAFTVVVARLRREAQKSAIEAQQLGKYTLERKLGSGAMGVVYKGRHAMLHRATAIKMLDVDKVTEASIRRFEREVQITCQLNHPNTIAIYDYGRTPEGVFYFAMEYLDGMDLEQLVEMYGPQSESRVIHLLLQVCGSLFEAHSKGLVHRDIKPANIMFNRRGCEPDVIKVLDFGLVKAVDEAKQSGLTAQGVLTGTPLYMSPESIESPMSIDARSDLYAVGAVGYFLLTGQSVFQADGIVELCQQHVDETPIPPSERLGRHVSSELEDALLTCLEKSREKRPQTARDLAQLLLLCPDANAWSIEEADAWWGRHERSQPCTPEPSPERHTGDTALDQTVVEDQPATEA